MMIVNTEQSYVRIFMKAIVVFLLAVFFLVIAKMMETYLDYEHILFKPLFVAATAIIYIAIPYYMFLAFLKYIKSTKFYGIQILNQEKKKLDLGVITQEEYDKKVEDFKEQALLDKT